MYKRITFYSLPSFTYFLITSPVRLTELVMWKIKKMPWDKCLDIWHIVNEMRKECNNFSEKDKQQRLTFLARFKVYPNYVMIKYRFAKKASDEDYEAVRTAMARNVGNCSPIEFKRGWAYVKAYMDYEPIEAYEATRNSVTIGTNAEGLVHWNMAEYPHMLIVGETGQGKTVMVRYVLNAILNAGYNVFCVDGKNVDYAKTSNLFTYYVGNTAKKKEEILKLIRKFDFFMRKRYEEMAEQGIDNYLQNPDYEPYFLLIDEQLNIIKQSDKVEKAEFEKLVSNIILLGRSAGFYLISTMQRADSKYLGGDLRDNYMCRIVVGKASPESYRMILGDGKLKGQPKGKAWYSLASSIDTMAIPFYKHITVEGSGKNDTSIYEED